MSTLSAPTRFTPRPPTRVVRMNRKIERSCIRTWGTYEIVPFDPLNDITMMSPTHLVKLVNEGLSGGYGGSPIHSLVAVSS